MKWLSSIVLPVLALLAPIKALMIAVGVLIIFDLITGMWAAKKRGEKITSAGMSRTIAKMVVYQMAIVSGFIVEKYLLEGFLPISKLIGGIIGMVEFKSLLENYNTITGTDLFKELINKLSSRNLPPEN